MRVMVLTRFFQSGQTTHALELARELARQGHVVTVLTQGRSHPDAWEFGTQALAQEAIETLEAEETEHALSLARLAKPEILHVHSSDLIPLAKAIAQEEACPLVVTAHGLGVARAHPEIAKADRVIAVGPRIYQELAGQGIGRLSLIANGVDTDRFRPGRKGRPFQIAYVGRIDGRKRSGLMELIEAVAMIPGARLLIASNEHPVHRACVSLGWVWDVAPLLAESHVVVGTGRAIREGMASGCAALVLGATYRGVVSPAALENGQNGALWFPQDGGEAPKKDIIRRDLVRLLQDDRHRRALGRWGREYACRHFSLKQMVQEIVGLYQEAVFERVSQP